MLPSEPALSALLARREEEWRALQDMALEEARGRLRSLQEDFVYNLQVLEERDRELERYDAAFARARGLEEAWQAEVSQLKVEAARLRQALAREAEQREDLQRLHQRELREHRLALERAHRYGAPARPSTRVLTFIPALLGPVWVPGPSTQMAQSCPAVPRRHSSGRPGVRKGPSHLSGYRGTNSPCNDVQPAGVPATHTQSQESLRAGTPECTAPCRAAPPLIMAPCTPPLSAAGGVVIPHTTYPRHV